LQRREPVHEGAGEIARPGLEPFRQAAPEEREERLGAGALKDGEEDHGDDQRQDHGRRDDPRRASGFRDAGGHRGEEEEDEGRPVEDPFEEDRGEKRGEGEPLGAGQEVGAQDLADFPGQVVGRETGRRRGEGRADVDSGNRPQDPDPPHRPEEKREDPERETRGQPPRRGPQNRLLRGADIHPTEEEIEEHRGQRERDDDLDRMRLHLLSGKEFLTVVLTFHGRVSAEKNEAKFLARLTFRTVFPILSIHFREDRSMSRPNSWLLGSLVVFAATLNAASASADPIGALETPTAGQVVSGVIPVSGYVLDFAGVDKVELFVDGSFRSRAQINIPRPDIIALFPQYANSPTRDPGYATSLNTRTLSAGPHLVTIRVTETGNTKTFDI